MVWASINVIFILAAIGIMLEKSQKRTAYRININNPKAFPMSYDTGITSGSCILENISHTGLGVRVTGMQPPPREGDVLSFDIYIPALDSLGRFHAQIVNLRKLQGATQQLGLVFYAESQEEKRTIVGLVYGWSDLSDYNQQHRQKRISPYAGLLYLHNTAVFHAWEHVLFLSREYLRASKRYVLSTTTHFRKQLAKRLHHTSAHCSPVNETPHEPPQ
jgi:cellulose synthase (UDP-forming)